MTTSWDFEIRRWVKNPHVTHCQATYTMINCMCYLMNINYTGVFRSPITHLLDVLIRRLSDTDNAEMFFGQAEITDLLLRLTTLKEWLRNNAPNLALNQIYIATRDANGVPMSAIEKHVWQQFKEIKNNYPQICMPFVEQNKTWTLQEINDLLDGTGGNPGIKNLKVIDLYTLSHRSITALAGEGVPQKEMVAGLYRTIKKAQRAEILVNHSNKPNDYCCREDLGSGNYDCFPNTGTFCSKTVSGDCSAASDSCPPLTEP